MLRLLNIARSCLAFRLGVEPERTSSYHQVCARPERLKVAQIAPSPGLTDASLFVQQLWQPGDVRRDAPRLVELVAREAQTLAR